MALLHSIGRMDGPGSTHPWIRKYIFPGGYAPALSEVVPVVERLRLWITDVEILRLHYAQTLRRGAAGSSRTAIVCARSMTSASAGCGRCIWSARKSPSGAAGHLVFQMQLAKAVDTVPLTRDYMLDWERARSAVADRAA